MTPLTAEESTSLLGYRVRSVRIGVVMTFGVVAAVAVFPFAAGHPALSTASYWAAVGVGLAGAALVGMLPWEPILRSRYGLPALYAWSAADILLIGWLVTASGGLRSPMWALYALTTIFMAMTFPRRAQVALAALTIGSYVLLVALPPGPAPVADLAVRGTVVALVALMASFLSRELTAATVRHGEARAEANRRAELLAEVAAATSAMVTADAAAVMAAAVDTLVALGFEVSGLANLDEAAGTVRFAPSRGVPPELMGGTYPIDAGVTALVRSAGRPVALSDYASYEAALPGLRDFGLRSVLAAPVRVEGRLAAVLVAGSRRQVAVTAGEFEAVELLAASTGQALAAAALDESLRRSEARFRGLTEHAADVVFVVDGSGCVMFASSPVRRLLGYDPQTRLGRPLAELMEAGEQAALSSLLAAARPGRPARAELRLRHRDGGLRQVEAVASDLRGEPAVGGITVTLHDVSAARAAALEAQARAAQARTLAALGHQALRADGFAVLLARAPGALAEALGVAGAAVFVVSDDRRELRVAGAAGGFRPPPGTRVALADHPALAELLAGAGRRPGHPARLQAAAGLLGRLSAAAAPQGMEVAIGGPRGAYGLLAVTGRAAGPLTPMDLDFLHAVANVIAAAAEREAARSALAHLEMHDPLTGLPNRELLTDRLAQALSALDEGYVAVAFIDLDRFKVVNDGLGHGAGDALLVAVAERLSAHRGPADLVARLGGDEFVAVAAGLSGPAEARELAGRLLAELRRPFDVAGRRLELTASIGVVLGRGGDDPMRLLRDADVAMYRAKDRGRDRVELFEAALHSRAVSLLELEHDLRRAVERGEFSLVYQPEVDLRTGAVRVAEALLRWDHPERGRVGPGDFVALAEDTGLILPIGEWVLRRACQDRARWARALGGNSPVVAVNVSVRQLSEGDLLASLTRVLRETGTDPDQVCLEITETAFMVEDALSTVRELRRLGVRLTIDDFGTGYSSLQYLRRLPVESLKIDRSFVGGVQDGLDDATIVEAVVGMAHALGKEAVAEGVETPLQAAALQELGCDMGQGYYWARPLPAGQLVEFAAARPKLPRPLAAGEPPGGPPGRPHIHPVE